MILRSADSANLLKPHIKIKLPLRNQNQEKANRIYEMSGIHHMAN